MIHTYLPCVYRTIVPSYKYDTINMILSCYKCVRRKSEYEVGRAEQTKLVGFRTDQHHMHGAARSCEEPLCNRELTTLHKEGPDRQKIGRPRQLRARQQGRGEITLH